MFINGLYFLFLFFLFFSIKPISKNKASNIAISLNPLISKFSTSKKILLFKGKHSLLFFDSLKGNSYPSKEKLKISLFFNKICFSLSVIGYWRLSLI